VLRVSDTSGPPATGDARDPDAEWPAGLSPGERFVDDLLAEAHLAAPYQLADMLARHGATLGVSDVVAYLADLQQSDLVPLLPPGGPPSLGQHVSVLAVDSTLAGRCFQQVKVVTQQVGGGALQVWLPLLDGSDRIGVLAVTVAEPTALERDGGVLRTRLLRLAGLTAELMVSKTMYGDTLVQLRRRGQMGLAAEMQWSLLPPLTFACKEVTIAAALEPAYEVAGDSVDYAVDPGSARFAIFDGMGHGLQAAQLASLAVAAYRNARRSGRSLLDTARIIDAAVTSAFRGAAFTTGVLAHLDTDTGLLTWINVGHPDPLLLRGHRLARSLHARPGLPFGLSTAAGRTEATFTLGSEQLEPSDRVLLYTDGVTETRSPDGDPYGVQRLTDLLGRNLAAGLPTPETMRRVVRSLLAYQQGQLRDDATLLLVEWRSGNEQALVP
jgi:serine phosphatase RsbU (regulator of sigma subunit)